jgi:hypothetical protein
MTHQHELSGMQSRGELRPDALEHLRLSGEHDHVRHPGRFGVRRDDTGSDASAAS